MVGAERLKCSTRFASMAVEVRKCISENQDKRQKIMRKVKSLKIMVITVTIHWVECISSLVHFSNSNRNALASGGFLHDFCAETNCSSKCRAHRWSLKPLFHLRALCSLPYDLGGGVRPVWHLQGRRVSRATLIESSHTTQGF